jgi:hypothetical protein
MRRRTMRPGILQRAASRPPAAPAASELARDVLAAGAKEVSMTDLLIVALSAALYGAAFYFVRLCERM